MIKIKEVADVYVTELEYDSLLYAYNKATSWMKEPPSFEQWVKNRRKYS